MRLEGFAASGGPSLFDGPSRRIGHAEAYHHPCDQVKRAAVCRRQRPWEDWMATPAQWEQLAQICCWALARQPDPNVAEAAARQLAAGEWRPIVVFPYDADGGLDVLSMKIRVEVGDGAGRWVRLVEAGWRDIDFTADDCFDCAADMRAQHELGIHPYKPIVIPDTPEAIDDL
jgi:hypothetical protein